jgi:serine/threonine-protein kinase
VSDELSAPAAFPQVFESLRLDAGTLTQPVDATFIPDRDKAPDPGLDSLPQLAVAQENGKGAELRFGTLLGEGGRGQVRLARQLSLRRDVAVKSLKGEAGAERTQELLREARITGGLEHPNVVPVYALGRGQGDEVLLVMKRVEGVPWGRLLRQEGPATSDLAIERHLEIFQKVCNAVEFAHSKGIVHRDLKPENVMVGEFGEVVVLDWGLAVSLEGDAERGLPKACDVKGLAGTPTYMPPELVEGGGTRVGRWTDVYLLGATLHDVFTGGPPHQGRSLSEVLERAFKSEPRTYGPEVPRELAEICRRAMARSPLARFASVAELAQAVRAFMRHRQSAQLAGEAQRRLDALPAPGTSGERGALHAALAQSRFGFEQALRTWPENPVAREGLARALTREVQEELAQGNLASAQRALAALPAPDPSLAEQVKALEVKLEEDAKERQRLEALERDLNPNVSSAARNVLLTIVGSVWFVVPIALGLFERAGTFSVTSGELMFGVIPWAIFALLATWKLRDGLFLNRMGKRMSLAIVVAVAAAGLVRAVTWGLGVDVHHSMVFELVVYAVMGAMGGLVDVRFFFTAGVYALGAACGARVPDWAMFIVGVSNFLALVPVAMLWDWLGSHCPARWTMGAMGASFDAVSRRGDPAR